MRTPPRILIADDNPANLDILRTRLSVHRYEILTPPDRAEALALALIEQPDLLLLDVMMPGMNGLDVCQRLKANATLPFMPIILVTAKTDSSDIVAGLEAGADEYLTKPVDQAALVARVKSMLRIKALHDTVRDQAIRLEAQAAELMELNQTLEGRLAEKLLELQRVSRLKRFLSPQVAELVISSGDETFLESHRREITVVFCDLRGFTAFSETAEPEEVMRVLGEFHGSMGELIFRFDGTLERFAGDSLMVFFNDPLPCPDGPARAVRMAVAMRERFDELGQMWWKRGHQLAFGVGIAHGYATLGKIGFEARVDYGAIGTVTNLASRLCDAAEGGQILIAPRGCPAGEARVTAERVGERRRKGLRRPVMTYSLLNVAQ